MISTASSSSDAELFDHPAHGPLHWFREWPNAEVPPFGAGVYTVWDDAGTLIYVGMSGRTITIDTQPRTKPYGLYTRLASHAGGRRSGDQFCVRYQRVYRDRETPGRFLSRVEKAARLLITTITSIPDKTTLPGIIWVGDNLL